MVTWEMKVRPMSHTYVCNTFMSIDFFPSGVKGDPGLIGVDGEEGMKGESGERAEEDGEKGDPGKTIMCDSKLPPPPFYSLKMDGQCKITGKKKRFQLEE